MNLLRRPAPEPQPTTPGHYESALADLEMRHTAALDTVTQALKGTHSVTALRDALLDVRLALAPPTSGGTP